MIPACSTDKDYLNPGRHCVCCSKPVDEEAIPHSAKTRVVYRAMDFPLQSLTRIQL
jgi:hypothetical protein